MDIALQRALPILKKREEEFEACRQQANIDELKLQRTANNSEFRAYGYLQNNPADGIRNLKLRRFLCVHSNTTLKVKFLFPCLRSVLALARVRSKILLLGFRFN